METLVLILVVAVPGCFALAVAYTAGSWFRSKLTFLPIPIRVTVAGFLPSVAVVGCFWIWHEIDYASHQAERGDLGYMGPLVILLYGWPFFLFIAIGSCLFAVYTFNKDK
jgi:hypothetical protein